MHDLTYQLLFDGISIIQAGKKWPLEELMVGGEMGKKGIWCAFRV